MKQVGVRRVVTRSGRGVRGYFPSFKMKTMIPYESLLERDAILLLEFSPDVIRYQTQPARIAYYFEGRLRDYYPDFEAEFSNELLTHIEVKPAKKLIQATEKDRFAAIAKHYDQSHIWFQILTEHELRKKSRLDNLRMLACYMPNVEDESDLMDSQQKLSMLPANTIAGATAVLGDIKLVYRLLAANYLSCNLDEPITSQTLICYRFMGGHHGTFH